MYDYKENVKNDCIDAERVTGEFYTHAELMEHPELCPMLGDVVEVIDSPVKGQNGLFYITSWNSARYCGSNNFYGHGLKKTLDQVTKSSLYWPPRNTSGTRAAHEANRTNTPKMRVMGPVSVAAFDAVRDMLGEAEKNLERVRDDFARWNTKGYRIPENAPKTFLFYVKPGEDESEFEHVRDFTKDPTFDRRDTHAPAWFKEVSEALERMARENGALLSAKRRKSTGTGLKIAKNGLYVRQDDGTFKLHGIHYSKDGRHDKRECVTLFARNYSRIPAGFALDVVNNSDSMTDYFEDDRATVYPDHPLYKVFRAAADGAKPYTLTEKDVETLKAYTDAKNAAEEARRKAEQEAYMQEEERKERHASEVIAEYVELFPGDSYHPHVVVQWSELGAMSEHAIKNAGELNECGATVFSVEAFENITGDLDNYFKDMKGYFKLKFTYFDGDFEFTDRCDLGEGTGSYGSRMRQAIEYIRKHAGDADERVMLDGGAMVTRDEYGSHARRYLEQIPATFDDLNATN
jgi:hypothetical protein